MTEPRDGVAGLPDTRGVRHPHRLLLRAGRPLARTLLRRRYAVRLHHPDRVPRRGPVILAANHIGLMDGPLLAIAGPRPVHALTKKEMFVGRTGTFLRLSGQIEVDRFGADPGAVKAWVRVLRSGGVVGVFPEGTRGSGELRRVHRGAAYLALVSGAPVVPVTFFGTRAPGAGSHALPPRGGPVDIAYGTAWHVASRPWPRSRDEVAAATRALRTHLLGALDEARQSVGRELPGPIPATASAGPAGRTTATGTTTRTATWTATWTAAAPATGER